MDSYDDSTFDSGCTCGCCSVCSSEAVFDDPVAGYDAEPVVSDEEPVAYEDESFSSDGGDAWFEPSAPAVDAEPDPVWVEAAPAVEPAPVASIALPVSHVDPAPAFGATEMGGFSAIAGTAPAPTAQTAPIAAAESAPVFGQTTMGGFSALASTDPAPQPAPIAATESVPAFGQTTMGGFSAIDTAGASTDVGLTIFGGETANNAAWRAANDEVARLAAVRNNFGSAPVNPNAAAEQAKYPSVVLGQLRQLADSDNDLD